MNRRRADAAFGVLVAAVLVAGGALTWDAYQQRQAADGMMGSSMMGSSMDTMHGTDPIWYLLGTVLAAAILAGFYLAVRDDLTAESTARPQETEPAGVGAPAPAAGHAGDTGDATAPEEQPLEQPAEPDDGPDETGAADAVDQSARQVLDLLPEDERRILEPVLDSPGLTQIELRDRADFSKSKVSQTVSDLEKRGLLYRERQGRTYRVYPGEDLEE